MKLETKTIPPHLPRGGTLGVVSPASPGARTALERGLEVVRAAGFRVVLGRHVLDRRGHLAGEDADRAADLHEMFARPDVDAVLCARGGSGAIRLLPFLDWDLIRQHAKPFIGYSDITILQLALLRCCGLPSFFGPMPASDMVHGPEPHTLEWLWRLVCEPAPAGEVHDARIAQAVTLVGGTAEGACAGGTLSLIVPTLGTPYEIETEGRVLFFEDIYESPARIERYLMQLRLAGKLQGVAGFLIGVTPYEATDEERARYLSFEEVFTDLLAPYGRPLVYGWPLGHLRSPLTIPQGIRVRLDADRKSLTVLEPCVR